MRCFFYIVLFSLAALKSSGFTTYNVFYYFNSDSTYFLKCEEFNEKTFRSIQTLYKVQGKDTTSLWSLTENDWDNFWEYSFLSENVHFMDDGRLILFRNYGRFEQNALVLVDVNGVMKKLKFSDIPEMPNSGLLNLWRKYRISAVQMFGEDLKILVVTRRRNYKLNYIYNKN